MKTNKIFNEFSNIWYGLLCSDNNTGSKDWTMTKFYILLDSEDWLISSLNPLQRLLKKVGKFFLCLNTLIEETFVFTRFKVFVERFDLCIFIN